MENISDGCFLYDNDERRSLDWRGWTVEGNNASSWATGSCVAFFTQNVLITIGDSYNYGALTQGIFIPPEQLVDFARIQAARIPS
jgi:hypothetical protein